MAALRPLGQGAVAHFSSPLRTQVYSKSVRSDGATRKRALSGRLSALALAHKILHIREGANELRRPLQSQQRLSLPLLHLRTSKNECTDPFRRCSN